MIPKLLTISMALLVHMAKPESSPCPASFKKVCHCGMAFSRYDNFRESKYTVNCTNTGFTDTKMLLDLPLETQVLIFVGNSLPNVPSNVLDNTKDYDSLEVMDLSNNHLRIIQGKSFHKVYNVKTLILDHNDIDISDKYSRPRILSNFESLERLHMTNAFTEKINASDYLLNLEDIFYESDLIYLKVLHLEQNEIWSIGDNEKVFCQLPDLEQILLGDNRLTDFDFRIDCLPSLRYIDLERNMISRLSPEATERLDTFLLKKEDGQLQIKLDDNPFNCDCRATNFIEWLKSTKIDVMHWKSYLCIDGYPQTNVEKTFDQIQDLHCPSNSYSTSNSVLDHIQGSESHHTTGNDHLAGHSSVTIGVLAFLLVFTTSLLLAVAFFHRLKMKSLVLPYWDYVTRKIGYTGISNEEAPQEVNV